MDFAIRYSQKVDSLVLMSSYCKVDDSLCDVLNQFKEALNISFEEFYDLILPMVLCHDVIEDNKEELMLLKQIESQTANTDAYIKAVEACMDFNAEDELAKIDIPTLILAGKYDEISRLDMQIDLQRKIRNSKLIVFEDSKHNLLVGKNNEKVLNIIKKENK